MRAEPTGTGRSEIPLCAWVVLLACFIAWPARVSLAQKKPEAAKGPSVASLLPSDAGQPVDYAGVEKCQSCHKAETTEFLKTTHSTLKIPANNSIQGSQPSHRLRKPHPHPSH